ncbi:MAG: RNA polymerase sigma factor RpoH [Proteobacteria bacterium]|nr:RNA polymerase sigma factor RpoH [Pseudomonadota bacterium]
MTNISNSTLPALSSGSGFLQYLNKIQQFPILTAEEEYEYGVRYQKDGDPEAAKMLIQSHLRLVMKIAVGFRNYGLPIVELVSEGNVGLVKAVKKFSPEKGFRFSTYAMWWIKAYIQEYILRSWSMVKMGTTVAQKKLFFNLRKIKNKLKATDDKNLMPHQIKEIAHDLNVPEKDVVEMNSRLHFSDSSLNYVVGDEGDSTELQDLIACDDQNQESLAIDFQEKSRNETKLKNAIAKLKPREQEIIAMRRLADKSKTLDELSKVYKVSCERIRQIEAAAIEKIRKEMNCCSNA